MDWNSDGKKDLLVGEKYGGQLTVFLNTGTDSAPVFTTDGPVRVSGSPFVASGGSDSVPYVTDWNSDGKIDVLCGGFDGRVSLLLNSSAGPIPEFNASSFIQSAASDLSVGSKSSPCVVDWNGDGKKDLLVGGEGSGLRYYENVGTDAEPVFGGYVAVKSDGVPIDGGNPRAAVVDWDGDGVPDLITGQMDGTLWFCRRTANDNDSDGMPDWWENRYLPEGTNATANADSDGDGISNRREFRCNTDPSDPASVLKLAGITRSGAELVISWQAAEGVEYVLESCNDLSSGVWSNISSVVTSGVYSVSSPASASYYRVQIP